MEKKYEENDEIQIDLMELFLALKKRIWLLILAAAAGALASGLYSCLILTPTYTSTSMLYVLSKETTLTSLRIYRSEASLPRITGSWSQAVLCCRRWWKRWNWICPTGS